MNLILVFFIFVVILMIYLIALKPYFTILRLKNSFQKKGYKVHVQINNFFKQSLFSTIRQKNIREHKDALYDRKYNLKGYDIAISNNTSIIYVQVISIPLLKQVFNKIQHLEKYYLFTNNFKRLYGGGLLIAQGQQWKKKRRLYSEIFNFKLLEQIHHKIEQTIEKTLSSWDCDKQVDLLKQFRKLFFKTFVVAYFGKQHEGFSYQNKTYQEVIVETFNKLYQQAFSLRHILLGTKFVEKGFTQEDKEINEKIQVVLSETKRFVQERFAQITKAKEQKSHSILSKVIFNENFQNLQGKQKEIMLQEISGDVLLFFAGGTDTTSSALATTIHLLHKHPKIVKKLLEQISKSDSKCSYTAIKQWKYMDVVLNQVLRMYGPVNFFVREIKDNSTSIGQVQLPKGAILGIQTVTVHHSDEYYEKPYQFIPERWINRKQIPYSFVAFSSGQRNCIGQHFSRIEYKICLAKFLQKFSFSTQNQLIMELPLVYGPFKNQFRLQKKQ